MRRVGPARPCRRARGFFAGAFTVLGVVVTSPSSAAPEPERAATEGASTDPSGPSGADAKAVRTTLSADTPAPLPPPEGAPVGEAAANGPALTLEDAVRLALQRNERALKAPLRVEQAEGQRDRARTAFFPSLTAGGTATWRPEEDRSGRNLTSNGTVTLAQPLLAPSAIAQMSQWSHQLESERWTAVQDRRVVAFETARSFLQAIASERVVDAAKQRLDRSRLNLQNADARAAAGLASTNDATRARVDLATALRDVANAQGSLARAQTQLGFLMGKRLEARLAAPERTDEDADAAVAAGPGQAKSALERRPDVRAAAERTAALRQSAKEPLYRLIPNVGAQAQLRVLPDPLPTERGADQSVTLSLSWNVFDAGARYADRKSRLAQAESQSLDEHQLRRSVQTDVDLALIALRTARDAYHVTVEQVAAAQQLTEESEILYRQGLARALELTDANGRRFDAEVARASARLSMQQAYLELRFALGLGPLDEDLPR